MRIRTFVFAWVLTLSSKLAMPQSQPAPQSSVLVKAGRLLDVRAGTYIEDGAIWIDGDRIKEVGRLANVAARAPKNARVIDLGRVVVLPGLIDCHTHLMARFADGPDGYLLGLATKSQAFRALEGAADARLTLYAVLQQYGTWKVKARDTPTLRYATPSNKGWWKARECRLQHALWPQSDSTTRLVFHPISSTFPQERR
jgi:hypothetical protein